MVYSHHRGLTFCMLVALLLKGKYINTYIKFFFFNFCALIDILIQTKQIQVDS